MNKPITLMEKETKQQIINTINNSELPAFILVYMFNEILEDLKKIQEEQLKRDQLLYDNSMEAEIE